MMTVGLSKHFNPKRLKAARVFAEMTIAELADQVGVSRQAISQFEQGKTPPSLETLMRIINVLQISREYLYKENNDVDYIGNTFFRSYTTSTKKQKEAQRERVNLIFEVQQFLEGYVNFPSINIPNLTQFKNIEWSNENIEELAQLVREHWGLGEKPILNMVHQLEKNGIFVTSVTTTKRDIDAFCQKRVYKGREYYFVVLGNDKQSAVRRQFDAAHELGHILMHSWLDDQEKIDKEELREIEKQADYFAAALLLPKSAFESSLYSTKLEEYINLKKYWMASIGAMIVRSYHLGLISYNQYHYLQKQLSRRKMRVKEPFDDVLKRAQPSIFRQTFDLILNRKLVRPEGIVSTLKMPGNLVEALVNLPSNTLSPTRNEEKEVIVTLRESK